MEKTKAQRKKQTKKARDKREKDSKINDAILENKINEIPGLTYVQLEKVFAKNEFKFKTSYLKNALHRLEEKKKIFSVLTISKEGKIVKVFESYDIKQETNKKKFNQIIIPKELIVNNTKWKNPCYVYAIKNNEFIITPEKNNKIDNTAFYKNTTKLNKSNDMITVIIPDPIIEYYQLDKDNINWNIENDLITILVTPKLQTKIRKSIQNILLLEDTPYWGDAFYKELTQAGHIVFRTDDFKIAENIMKEQEIDWCIIDDEIKNKKGAEKFFAKFKKVSKNVNGIFITSYPIPKAKSRYLKQLGFKSIIKKRVESTDEERDPEEVAAEQLVRIQAV